MSTDQQAPLPENASDEQMATIVAPHVQLLNVILHNVTASLRDHPNRVVNIMAEQRATANLEWRAKGGVEVKEKILGVTVQFRVALVEVSHGETKGRDLANIESTFVLEYLLDSLPPLSPDDASKVYGAFSRINGVLNAWPYLRELAQNTFGRMALPPVILPVYRVKNPPRNLAEPTASATKPPDNAP